MSGHRRAPFSRCDVSSALPLAQLFRVDAGDDDDDDYDHDDCAGLDDAVVAFLTVMWTTAK